MVTSSSRLQELIRRGHDLYDRNIRANVEPEHNGEFLILNVESGEYELDPDDAVTSMRAKLRFSTAPLVTIRVGHQAAYRIGARGVAEP